MSAVFMLVVQYEFREQLVRGSKSGYECCEAEEFEG
jgi:hypothetical protein